jgi:hypothetical protein
MLSNSCAEESDMHRRPKLILARCKTYAWVFKGLN